MNWIATSRGLIVPRILGITVVVLLLTVGVAAARTFDLRVPGSDLLVPAMVRAADGEGNGEDDDYPDGGGGGRGR